MDVGIVGAGAWGITLAHIAVRNRKSVMLWTRKKDVAESINLEGVNPERFPEYPLPRDKVRATVDLEELFSECDFVVIAVSSDSFRSVVEKFAPYVQGHHIIVSSTKGIEVETGKRMTEIVKELTCCRRIGVITGPNIAVEILKGYPSAAVASSKIVEVQLKIKEVFSNDRFKIYRSWDVVGCEIGGALKNIYAIAGGIASAMGFYINSFAFLLSRACVEMMRLGVKMGADPRTFSGLAGMGDLIATASSPNSRNRTFGELIAKGMSPRDALRKIGQAVEGYGTSLAVRKLIEKYKVDMPIASTVYSVVWEGMTPQEGLERLLSREVDVEFDID